MAVATTDGGEAIRDFSAAIDTAHSRIVYEHGPEDAADYAMPYDDLDGVERVVTWAMSSTRPVLLEAVRSDRLDDEDGAAPSKPRTPRTFLFGYDGSDDPTFVVLGSFVNRWDDERVVIETPAPWETPDSMASGNDLIKELEWDDHHYSFEDRIPQTGDEDAWIIDRSGVEPLRQLAEEAGYEWDEDDGQSPDEQTLANTTDFLVEAEVDRDDWELVGGDDVFVRYESKQTGGIKEKSGTVTGVRESGDSQGFSFERVDGKTNTVKVDGGEVGIYSTSQYPFMGSVRSVEVLPGDSQ